MDAELHSLEDLPLDEWGNEWAAVVEIEGSEGTLRISGTLLFDLEEPLPKIFPGPYPEDDKGTPRSLTVRFSPWGSCGRGSIVLGTFSEAGDEDWILIPESLMPCIKAIAESRFQGDKYLNLNTY